jgi:hypothetical protein
VEIVQQPAARSEKLHQQLDASNAPDSLQQEAREMGLDFLSSAEATALNIGPIDVMVCSVLPEVVNTIWRDRQTGYFVDPPSSWAQSLTSSQQDWFCERFEPIGPQPVDWSATALASLVGLVKSKLGAHVIIYNCSPLDPGDRTHNYVGVEETLYWRVQKFNFALLELSVNEGISIVDAERIVAEHGEHHVPRALEYSAEVHQQLCSEFVRILSDIGFFEQRPLLMQVGKRER